MSVAIEVTAILLLMIGNGLFAMAEMALVSARKPRLQQRADEGDAGAAAALAIAEDPDDFLATVQIGITLIGVLAGAFGGATIAGELADALDHVPFLAPYSDVLSVGLVVLTITYISLVIGELAPKQFALGDSERLASRIAPSMSLLSRIASPIAHFLSLSAEAVLRLVGVQSHPDLPVTEAELKLLLEEGTEVGVFEPLEERMVERVLDLDDRRVSSLLTPRTDVVWIDVADTMEEIQDKITRSGHSRYPVAEGSLDNVVGLVLAKDLLAQTLMDQEIDVEAVLRPALFVPEVVPTLEVLEQFREAHSRIALVLDEYGGLQGLVTTSDILMAIVGEIQGLGDLSEPEVFQREDGSWLLDGRLSLEEFEELFRLSDLPAEGTDTLGGLVMTLLGRIPSIGDQVEWRTLCLEVVDMDGRRVDKVLVVPVASTAD
jgi:putative hemolysin